MQNFSFLPFFLIIIAILILVVGLILLIIGLIQNKTRLWIPGAVIIFLAFIAGTIGAIGSINIFKTTVVKSIEKIKEMNNHKNNIFTDTVSYSERPVDSTFSEPTSGFIEDSDNSLIYIKVFPKNSLSTNGITVEKVDTGKKCPQFQQAISLILKFDKNYTGKIKLVVYDYEKNELGISTTSISAKQDEIKSINFPFADNVTFSIIDHCTLYIE